jgi:hypothetical protein
MPTNEENIEQLKQAVIKLSANKLDIVDYSANNNMHVTRYLDLKTAYDNLKTRVESLELWINNHITGNYI